MPSIGQRLDSILNQVEHNIIHPMSDLSPTQLYGVIVIATIAFSFVLLGNGGNDLELPSSSANDVDNSKPRNAGNNTNNSPQPRWFIFKWINTAFIVAFLASVIHFAVNATEYLSANGVVLKYLIGWSTFLMYFFGFFGISFVHDEIGNEDEESNRGVGSSSKSRSNNVISSDNKKSPLHPPAKSTPVCSDPKKNVVNKITTDITTMQDSDIAQLVLNNQLKDHELEKRLDAFRAVEVRRLVVKQKLATLNCNIDNLPTTPSLDYSKVYGANCEVVVGYVPLPVGLVGPLTLNNETVYVPMATTEGCLVASTNRGAKAITQSAQGAHAMIIRDGITRAPCVRLSSAMEAARLKVWCETPENFAVLKQAFESTTSFGKLKSCNPTVAGKNVYIRLVCFAGDAMGMNMVSKGSLAVIEVLKERFENLELVALSGNMCTDKKAAATNWLEGRGKSVVVECNIPASVVRTTLKTTVKALIHTNINKNLIGSAMAGALGGFNAHASNIVAAVFLATGQDPAQVVESANCITLMEETEEGDLWMSCTMPSIEVGTVGGGTSLSAQAACLDAIGCRGGGKNFPGENAQKLSTVVAAATMAGELSLLSALAANTLVQAHMQHNRKTPTK